MSDGANKFQTAVSTGLAIALGGTLMVVLGPNSATAYPSGAVSYGGNPVWSVGGTVSDGSSLTPITAPSGQDIVITDVVVSGGAQAGSDYLCGVDVTLQNGAGDSLGVFRGAGSDYYNSSGLFGQNVSFSSGIRVEAGDSLTLLGTDSGFVRGNCSLTYTLSGYYAEP